MILRIVNIINVVNDKIGQLVSLIFIPLTIICVIEVMMRYLFNKPTIWGWEIDGQLFCLLTVMGAGYTLLYKGHVKIEVFLVFLSEKSRLLLELVTSFIVIITLILLIQQTGIMAFQSISVQEVSSTFWGPPVYPIKVFIFIGVILLFFQFISDFLATLGRFAGLYRSECPEEIHQEGEN